MQTRISSKSILTGSLAILLCLILAVPAMAQRPSLGGLQAQIDALQAQLAALQASPVFDLEGLVTVDETSTLEGVVAPHIIVEGANLHVRSGSGETDDGGTLRGLGNVIIGYNESNGADTFNRRGSHNLVVGQNHQYMNFGGFVAGQDNVVSGAAARMRDRSASSRSTRSRAASMSAGSARSTYSAAAP